MPLPSLTAHHAAAANAVEYRKRVLLGEPPEAAAHAVGGPLDKLEQHPAGQALARAIEPDEQQLLRDTAAVEPELARGALESREGRTAWLSGVALGTIKHEGAFGNLKQFPPAARLMALRLLGLMHGDYTMKSEVKVTHDAVITFHIPDNGRVPEEFIEMLPEESSTE